MSGTEVVGEKGEGSGTVAAADADAVDERVDGAMDDMVPPATLGVRMVGFTLVAAAAVPGAGGFGAGAVTGRGCDMGVS